MTIAVVLFFASGHMIGNQQAFAFGGYGYGHGFGHYYGHGFGHYYGPNYGSGYPAYIPCDGEPYSIINGQIVCIQG